MTARKIFALVIMLLAANVSFAQEAPALKYKLKQFSPDTGSHIPRDILRSSMPLDKTYRELSDEHKAMVRAEYEAMLPEDEPPFPLDGLGPLYDTLRKVSNKLDNRGDIAVVVTVDSNGEGVSARVLKAEDAQIGRYAAQVGMLTRFKPALCSGKPCTMDFVIRMSVTRSLQ